MSRLYAFGSNGSGQLGVGHFDDISQPELCKLRSTDTQNGSLSNIRQNTLTDTRFCKIVAGGNHTLALTRASNAFAAGHNADGRCGLPISAKHDCEFQLLEEMGSSSGHKFFPISDIAATWEASFFVNNHGSVWTCGTGSKGELGLGPEVTNSKNLSKIFDVKDVTRGDSICSISASISHIILLTDTGDAYGWGTCRKGQLGDDLIKEKIVWRPTKLTLAFKARQVVTGREFTFFVGENGEQQLFGKSKHLPHSLNLTVEDSNLCDTQFELLQAGWSSIYCLSGTKGQRAMRAWGRNDRGQQPPESLPVVEAIAAGSEHCIASTAKGEVIAWGWGEHGNCGTSTDQRDSVAGWYNNIPLPFSGDWSVDTIAAGCATSFILARNEGSS